MENLTAIIPFLIGAVVGALAIWFLFGRIQAARAYDRARAEAETERATLTERLAAKERAAEQFSISLINSQAELSRLADEAKSETTRLREVFQAETARLNDELRKESSARSAEAERAAAKSGRVEELEAELREQSARTTNLQSEVSNLRAKLSDSEARREEEAKLADEKLGVLNKAREELTAQFENLANRILDAKSVKFTEQNKTNIESLLKPLGEKIRDFEKKVEDTYDKESKQRFSLEKEIANLRDLNTRISQDAINLTNALKGQTKTQGNWGEQILETILQNAGLVKGQHYDLQVSINTEDGRRVQPDVILHLPEDRHIVVDSKVNLTAYTRYSKLQDGPERDAELKKHVAAFRNHVAELSGKQYQDHYKLTSLEFVLLFVPLEPAFMLALEADESIYDFAFQKRISIVTPSTLHATVHTVSNMWRQDNQNKNAMKIAEEAGKLFDKFVSFADDLEDVGAKLLATQKSYDGAHNKLTSGRGNLVGRAENLRLLGAKASKKMPARLLDATADDGNTDGADLRDSAQLLE